MTTEATGGRRGRGLQAPDGEGRGTGRGPEGGVILLATLLLLVLLAGVAVAAQARALAQARVLARVADGIEARAAASSARARLLPLVGEALLDQQADGALAALVRLDGEPTRVEMDGRSWAVTIERLEREGWVRMDVKEG